MKVKMLHCELKWEIPINTDGGTELSRAGGSTKNSFKEERGSWEMSCWN
jgi:hypothetical protein